ncbi:unnamed protein product [Rotaria socialis]
MEPTRSNYTALSYGVPFGSFAVLFILISIINKRSNWFILGLILGIDKATDDPPKPPHCVYCGSTLTSSAKEDQSKNSSDVDSKHLGYCVTCKKVFSAPVKSNPNIGILPESGNCTQCKSKFNLIVREEKVEPDKQPLEKYLYIDFENGDDVVPQLKCFIRVLSDLLTAAILAVFVSIIFSELILSNQTVKNGRKCPTFDADCFTTQGNYDVLPYSCIDGNYVNISNYNDYVWCVAWVYQDKTAQDVLDTLGTCGGLLGIISCIVPLVYYLSYNKKHNWLTCFCIVIPLSGFSGLAWMLWYTWDDRPSQLAVTAFAVAVSMMTIGWLWAVWRACFLKGADDGCSCYAFLDRNRCYCLKWLLKKLCYGLKWLLKKLCYGLKWLLKKLSWVYQDQTAQDVLDTLGTCGGLLGIISCIVPLVYYLSYNKKHNWLSCFCIVIPLSGFGGLAWMLWYTWDARPSQLAVTAFAVAVSMMTIGWLWAVWRACFLKGADGGCSCYAFQDQNRCHCPKWLLKKLCCCKLCYCCCHIVCGKYTYYPWACLRDFWKYFCCCCCGKSYEQYKSCPRSFSIAGMELPPFNNRVALASTKPSTKEPYMI